jgi:hypothetical protein
MTVPTSPGPRPRLHPFTVVDEFRALKARLRKLESFNKPGWIAITGAAGFTPQTFGYAPAYTLFPNGRVELRGIFVKSAASLAISNHRDPLHSAGPGFYSVRRTVRNQCRRRVYLYHAVALGWHLGFA